MFEEKLSKVCKFSEFKKNINYLWILPKNQGTLKVIKTKPRKNHIQPGKSPLYPLSDISSYTTI